MERADTIEALPVSTARGSIDLTRAHTHSPIRDVTHEVRRRLSPEPHAQAAHKLSQWLWCKGYAAVEVTVSMTA